MNRVAYGLREDIGRLHDDYMMVLALASESSLMRYVCEARARIAVFGIMHCAVGLLDMTLCLMRT